MARITLASLSTTIAALEAQLAIANEVCANQRDTIARLEETCAAQAVRLDNAVAYFKAQRAERAEPSTPVVVAPQPKPVAAPTITRYTDKHGQVWERTRYSSTRSICRPVEVSAAEARQARYAEDRAAHGSDSDAEVLADTYYDADAS